MTRITKTSGGVPVIPHDRIRDAACVLAAYEDTGLTPEEIIDGKLLTGWISVGERLPDEPDNGMIELGNLTEYIVMIFGATKATVLYYAGDGEWYSYGEFYKVVAWMPLPEPYKG
ncbi:MAG: DUF551 domain-containing protein [Clostridium sp.]